MICPVEVVSITDVKISMSVALGVAWLFMPATPLKARFLSDEQRVIAIERTAENMTGTSGHEGARRDSKEPWSHADCLSVVKLSQVWQTLKDPMYYLIVLYTFIAMVPNGISSFNSESDLSVSRNICAALMLTPSDSPGHLLVRFQPIQHPPRRTAILDRLCWFIDHLVIHRSSLRWTSNDRYGPANLACHRWDRSCIRHDPRQLLEMGSRLLLLAYQLICSRLALP